MREHTVVHLREVEDLAPKFGLSPGMQARFVRVPPEVPRAFEAGPEGFEMVVFGAPNTGNQDVEALPGWWTG